MSFTQKGKTSELVPGRDGKVHKEIECHNCHQIGHYANQCPHKKKITLAQFTLAQNKLELIDRNWVLLDTCSTVSVFCNSKLVNDIREVCPGSSLTGITNGGLQTYKYTANFNLLPLRVHFNTHSIANILSLSDIANLPNTKITMDSSKEKVMLLHHNGRIIKFEECVDGHYYWDSKETSSLKSKDSITAYSFINTVANNRSWFTQRNVKGAEKERKLQSIIAWPGDQQYHKIIQTNQLMNSSLIIDDVICATEIHGPALPILQSRTTRVKPTKVQVQKLPLPLQNMQMRDW